jgi:hypothetical protein
MGFCAQKAGSSAMPRLALQAAKRLSAVLHTMIGLLF